MSRSNAHTPATYLWGKIIRGMIQEYANNHEIKLYKVPTSYWIMLRKLAISDRSNSSKYVLRSETPKKILMLDTKRNPNLVDMAFPRVLGLVRREGRKKKGKKGKISKKQPS